METKRPLSMRDMTLKIIEQNDEIKWELQAKVEALELQITNIQSSLDERLLSTS